MTTVRLRKSTVTLLIEVSALGARVWSLLSGHVRMTRTARLVGRLMMCSICVSIVRPLIVGKLRMSVQRGSTIRVTRSMVPVARLWI